MTGQPDKENVLRDYGVFLKALLPQAVGFVCHDRTGRVCWSERPAEVAFPVTDDYRALLSGLLLGRTATPGDEPLALGGNFAYVLPLDGETQNRVGTLTVLMDGKLAAVPFSYVAGVLGPATRILQRELLLRGLLLDGHRKLTVQAAEERLLHQVEEILHERQPCEFALQAILDLCQQHLGVGAAMLMIPDKSILAVSRSSVTESEAARQCAELLGQARDPAFDPSEVAAGKELVWTPVHRRNHVAQGVFALTGCGRSEFSQQRALPVTSAPTSTR
jgi:hypothetical protein